jgi:hypothetical protein
MYMALKYPIQGQYVGPVKRILMGEIAREMVTRKTAVGGEMHIEKIAVFPCFAHRLTKVNNLAFLLFQLLRDRR